MSTIGDRMRTLVRVASEDALFAVLALPEEPRKSLLAMEKRRAETYDAAARGAPIVDASRIDLFLAVGTRALVSIGAPWFVPMRAAIDEGLSMERVGHGILARLAGQGPLERVRRVGAFAVRIARAVAAADGPLSADEMLALDLLLAALALPDDEARVLRAEPPMPLEAIEVPDELETTLARAVVAGAWDIAATDGLSPDEQMRIESIARKLVVHSEDMETMRKNALQTTNAQQTIGSAAIDAIRYVSTILDAARIGAIVAAAVPLAVPPLARAETKRTIDKGDPTPLGRAHEGLDRPARVAVLAAAWSVATSVDPSLSLRACLAARHDRVGIDLGAEKDSHDARALVDDHLARVLERGVAGAGG